MNDKNLNSRLIILYVLIFVFTFFCIVRLFNLQIVNGDSYRETAMTRMIRAYPIKAPRGEILDTYGRPLVTNSMGYFIQIQSMDKYNSKLNETINRLMSLTKDSELTYINDFPINKDLTLSFSDRGCRCGCDGIRRMRP